MHIGDGHGCTLCSDLLESRGALVVAKLKVVDQGARDRCVSVSVSLTLRSAVSSHTPPPTPPPPTLHPPTDVGGVERNEAEGSTEPHCYPDEGKTLRIGRVVERWQPTQSTHRLWASWWTVCKHCVQPAKEVTWSCRNCRRVGFGFVTVS